MSFQENILSTYGQEGEEWLKNLSFLAEHISQEWNLRNLIPLSNLSHHYVLVGTQRDLPIILKLGIDKDSLTREATALKSLQNYGGISLLAEDLDQGALLLEQAVPGNSLKGFFPYQDGEAIKITVSLMRQLHQAPILRSHSFPSLENWLSIIDQPWNLPECHL